MLDRWRRNDPGIELLEQSAERLLVQCRLSLPFCGNVPRLGLAELGASLSCKRNFALAEGFSPEIRLPCAPRR